jgi:hypothetical protein
MAQLNFKLSCDALLPHFEIFHEWMISIRMRQKPTREKAQTVSSAIFLFKLICALRENHPLLSAICKQI